jgi:hypothetical protein
MAVFQKWLTGAVSASETFPTTCDHIWSVA